jgi:hypothetical protein
MIANTITQKIGEALKAHEELELSVYRMLSSALNYEKIAKQHELSEEEEIVVVRREVKKRADSIESLKSALGKKTTAGGDTEIHSRIKKDEDEINILKEFLPPEMPDAELEKIVDDAISQTGASQLSDMGKVMSVVIPKVSGKASGQRISELVKSKLS